MWPGRHAPDTTETSRPTSNHEAEIADELLARTLPILEDGGYIEVDETTNTVHRGPDFDEVDAVLELFDDESDDVYRGWP